MKSGSITFKRCQTLDVVKLTPNIIGGLEFLHPTVRVILN